MSAASSGLGGDVELVIGMLAYCQATYQKRIDSGGVWANASGSKVAGGTRTDDSVESQVFLGGMLPLACGHNKNLLDSEKEALTQQLAAAFPSILG